VLRRRQVVAVTVFKACRQGAEDELDRLAVDRLDT